MHDKEDSEGGLCVCFGLLESCIYLPTLLGRALKNLVLQRFFYRFFISVIAEGRVLNNTIRDALLSIAMH